MNSLNRYDQLLILKLVCRSSGINDIVEITGHSPNTVRRHLAQFGEALTAMHDRLVRDISPTRVEVDEIWSYVYAKREKNIATKNVKRPAPLDFGEFYTWVALDPDSKLFITWLVGDRSERTGRPFLKDLRSRIVGRILITSDGHSVYRKLIKEIFGKTADHAVIEKDIEGWRNPETGERGSRVKSLVKKRQSKGMFDISRASTSLVERLNGSIRNFTSRFTRQTYKFSKRLANHVHAQAVFVAYYNFVKHHGGFKGPERHLTPAMKAGLTDKVWTFDDLLDEVDRYWQHKTAKAKLKVRRRHRYKRLPLGAIPSLPYVVVYSLQKRIAKIHRSSCHSCKHGLRSDKRERGNEWYAFRTRKAARRCAKILSPIHHTVCSFCITGHYVKHH